MIYYLSSDKIPRSNSTCDIYYFNFSANNAKIYNLQSSQAAKVGLLSILH